MSESGRLALTERPGMVEPSLEDLDAGRVRVAAEEGRIAGFAVSVRGDDGRAELDGLFVDPSAWRRGLGRRLVNDAASRARDEGASRLSVTANLDAVSFYEALGFVVDRPVDTDFGPAARMHRRLG